MHTGQITINLAALRDNYRLLRARARDGALCGASVKANAYGLGASAVTGALYEEGCRHFFTANLPEALEMRALHEDTALLTLNGLIEADIKDYINHNITPALASLEELAFYNDHAKMLARKLPAYIHIDTAMNRRAVAYQSAAEILEHISHLDIQCIMSHFACADEVNHPHNAMQLQRFIAVKDQLTNALPDALYSLCNSAGIFLGAQNHFDLLRPGMALYGLNPTPYAPKNPMRRVVDVTLPVLDIKQARANETIGYGGAHRFDADTPYAVIGAGYADGIFRSLSNKGALYWRGVACPIIGRVSMDLLCVDLSAVPNNQYPQKGEALDYIGAHQSPDQIGALAGSFDYEILTSLSRRFKRNYM